MKIWNQLLADVVGFSDVNLKFLERVRKPVK
jgi:hypothetical protein